MARNSPHSLLDPSSPLHDTVVHPSSRFSGPRSTNDSLPRFFDCTGQVRGLPLPSGSAGSAPTSEPLSQKRTQLGRTTGTSWPNRAPRPSPTSLPRTTTRDELATSWGNFNRGAIAPTWNPTCRCACGRCAREYSRYGFCSAVQCACWTTFGHVVSQ